MLTHLLPIQGSTVLPRPLPPGIACIQTVSDESLCCPGFIQPYGAILALRSSDLRVWQASENLYDILYIPMSEVLGKPLRQVLEMDQYQLITEQLARPDMGLGAMFEMQVSSPNPGGLDVSLRCQLHPIAEGILLEMEPWPLSERSSELDLYHSLQQSLLKLRQSADCSDLVQRITQVVAQLTQFDRVMVYQFMDDDHGVVIAETKHPDQSSYLGLHYPAFDIPQAARRLFLRHWTRMIPDVAASPVKLVSIVPDSPLDLSATTIRGVSPYYVNHIKTMDVGATFTISIIVDQRLWGLIACHHRTPKRVGYGLRKTCELLGQFISTELTQLQYRSLYQYQSRVKTLQDDLHHAFEKNPGNSSFIAATLIDRQDELCKLVQADGMAMVLDQNLILMGKTPSKQQVQDLALWIAHHHAKHLFATDRLPDLYPPAHAFKETASGVLAISVRLSQASGKAYHILWFRPEQTQWVNWAGKPENAITIDELGRMDLSPRKSFRLWQETVTERAVPWSGVELEVAKDMRNLLMLAVLEFSHLALAEETDNAKRAVSANNAKSSFIAKMSHELRTPLNVILGFTQILLRDQLVSPENQKILNTISRSGEHLLVLINDVLEMSKIESGQIDLNCHRFSLDSLVCTIQDMFTLKATEKNLTFEVERRDYLPRYVVGDEAKLRQILINLLSNAIKFTDRGQVTLRLSSDPKVIETLGQSQTQLDLPIQFDVIDTGCGIPIAEQESIFGAFHQTQAGRFAHGTGLGLTISRQFAQLMGGDIQVTSSASGSCFTGMVVLQATQLANPCFQCTNQKIRSLAEGQPNYKILVVEDEPNASQMLKTLLRRVGFDVMIVADGATAIDSWQMWQPHLILMDIQLPDMDGCDVTQIIRQQETRLLKALASPDADRRIPIIALTASAFGTDRDRCLDSGCDTYMVKPFEVEALLGTIATFLDVRYCYDAIKHPPQGELPKLTPLTHWDFTHVPLSLRQNLKESALSLDDKAMMQIIDQISARDGSLSNRLRKLVEEFEFERIAQLVDESDRA